MMPADSENPLMSEHSLVLHPDDTSPVKWIIQAASRNAGTCKMRSLLYESAGCLIHQVKRFSALKSWAVRLVGRKGFKKAAVATARKLAVLMLTIWKDGTEFEWKKEAFA